ncbi:DNA-directed RNA polymerases II, IV and V subunit 9B-like [Panicum miliaceum]|uniref:DNA-directed RNA polymerases II, IV and V subunit 9B-like n=1 Tax=Panicum miliaceum TaxID=4540 RepID=A0A3L6PJ72_PANMI|nr:DNA-directed RNA polymerases II, IV and V subunit 9B-like [Panicum miliaceum]
MSKRISPLTASVGPLVRSAAPLVIIFLRAALACKRWARLFAAPMHSGLGLLANLMHPHRRHRPVHPHVRFLPSPRPRPAQPGAGERRRACPPGQDSASALAAWDPTNDELRTGLVPSHGEELEHLYEVSDSNCVYRNVADHAAGEFTQVLFEDVASDPTLPRTKSVRWCRLRPRKAQPQQSYSGATGRLGGGGGKRETAEARRRPGEPRCEAEAAILAGPRGWTVPSSPRVPTSRPMWRVRCRLTESRMEVSLESESGAGAVESATGGAT